MPGCWGGRVALDHRRVADVGLDDHAGADPAERDGRGVSSGLPGMTFSGAGRKEGSSRAECSRLVAPGDPDPGQGERRADEPEEVAASRRVGFRPLRRLLGKLPVEESGDSLGVGQLLEASARSAGPVARAAGPARRGESGRAGLGRV